MTEVSGKKLTIEEAAKLLGGRRIYLDLPDVIAEKEAKGEAEEAKLWYLELTEDGTFQLCRGDQRLMAVGFSRELGHLSMPMVIEDPWITEVNADGKRVVGQVVVVVNPRGLVKTRSGTSYDGPTVEVHSASAHKIVKENLSFATTDTLVGYFNANPKRISGVIAVHLVREEFADSEGMSPQDIVKNTLDGRAVNAIAKAGLL